MRNQTRYATRQGLVQTPERETNQTFAVGLARAFGGGIIFALPMFMTMEMWWLGFYMDRFRLMLLALLNIPLLTALSYHSDFEETFSLRCQNKLDPAPVVHGDLPGQQALLVKLI